MITSVEKKQILEKAIIQIHLESAEEVQAFKNVLSNAEFAMRQRQMSVTSINKIEHTILKDLQNRL